MPGSCSAREGSAPIDESGVACAGLHEEVAPSNSAMATLGIRLVPLLPGDSSATGSMEPACTETC